jgi:REP element-mobilizing transposase RayT
MAETFTKLYIHVVFAVHHRQPLIADRWACDLFAYINGIVKNNNHKLIAINGMPDHIHLLISLSPEQAISDLVRDIKSNATHWINTNQMNHLTFKWQRGYSAFAVSFNDVRRVTDYIKNQQEHHRIKSFQEEYVLFLKENNIDFKEQYLFQ